MFMMPIAMLSASPEAHPSLPIPLVEVGDVLRGDPITRGESWNLDAFVCRRSKRTVECSNILLAVDCSTEFHDLDKAPVVERGFSFPSIRVGSGTQQERTRGFTLLASCQHLFRRCRILSIVRGDLSSTRAEQIANELRSTLRCGW